MKRNSLSERRQVELCDAQGQSYSDSKMANVGDGGVIGAGASGKRLSDCAAGDYRQLADGNSNNKCVASSAASSDRSRIRKQQAITNAAAGKQQSPQPLSQQQQQQQHQQRFNSSRLDERRSTYCSSIGANTTTELNYDSSLSSTQNCFECPANIGSDELESCAMGRTAPGLGGGSGARASVTLASVQDIEDQPAGLPNKEGSSLIQLRGDSFDCINASNDKPIKKRENWDRNFEFLLAVIGFAVDLGNVWRFPHICYKNGGGAFLIPYTIIFILGGLPIFYLEMSLGQYFASGCLTVWRRVCPMAKGIGYSMCVLNFFTGLYYNTIISWAVYFYVESFAYQLPWTSCNNSWNQPHCITIEQREALAIHQPASEAGASTLTNTSLPEPTSPTREYFERQVLQAHKSQGIDDPGSIRAPLAAYLAIVFVCIYLAIWKGVKSTGKAVWITALLPYFVLVPLLVRGVLLDGAAEGIQYYLKPNWNKIRELNVWIEAAEQIYFSLGPGFGTLMALSSYNKFHHNCRRDALIAASVNYFASFIAGLVIFAVLGYMAAMQNVNIDKVATEGPDLVFYVYPEGLATMKYSSMWSVLFFMMVISLGIDSTFGGLESVITGLCDEYPRTLRAHRGKFIGLLIIVIYLCSLPTTTYGGKYMINLIETYGTSLPILFVVLAETIVICWVYGVDRFCLNLEEMTGKKTEAYWRICWKYISPTILLLIFFAACYKQYDKYRLLNLGDYVYPGWAPVVGLLMTSSIVCCVPIYAIYHFRTQTHGTFRQRLRTAMAPINDPTIDDLHKTTSGVEKYTDSFGDKIRDHDALRLDTDI